jgi:hypothetical protein
MFRLGRFESHHSTGIDLRMILHSTFPLMRQEFIDDRRLFVGLGFGIGSQNEEETGFMRDFGNDSARLSRTLGALMQGQSLGMPSRQCRCLRGRLSRWTTLDALVLTALFSDPYLIAAVWFQCLVILIQVGRIMKPQRYAVVVSIVSRSYRHRAALL